MVFISVHHHLYKSRHELNSIWNFFKMTQRRPLTFLLVKIEPKLAKRINNQETLALMCLNHIRHLHVPSSLLKEFSGRPLDILGEGPGAGAGAFLF